MRAHGSMLVSRERWDALAPSPGWDTPARFPAPASSVCRTPGTPSSIGWKPTPWSCCTSGINRHVPIVSGRAHTPRDTANATQSRDTQAAVSATGKASNHIHAGACPASVSSGSSARLRFRSYRKARQAEGLDGVAGAPLQCQIRRRLANDRGELEAMSGAAGEDGGAR